MSSDQLELFGGGASCPEPAAEAIATSEERRGEDPAPDRRDFARPGLVDRASVQRSVAEFRKDPEARYTWRKLTAEEFLREGMAQRLENIGAIDRVYGDALNEWAATTRERLWLEHLTAEAILKELTAHP